MNVDLKKYYDENYIILNKIDTWPDSAKKYLDDNIQIIKNYFYEDAKIERIKIEKKDDYEDIYDITNNYLKAFNDIEFEFKRLFFEPNRNFIVYHATRLTDFELNDIHHHGLSISSLKFINDKINLLYANNVITEEEKLLLLKSHSLNEGKFTREARINKLYFVIGDEDISYIEENNQHNPSNLYDYFDIYGGEIIGDVIKKDANLKRKFKKVSKPYILVNLASSSLVYDNLKCYMEKIIRYYVFRNFELCFSLYTEDASDINFLCACLVDENSKIIY